MKRVFLMLALVACEAGTDFGGDLRSGDLHNTDLCLRKDAVIHYVMTCTYEGEHEGWGYAACPEPVRVVLDGDFEVGDTVTVVYATCDTPGREAAVQMALAPGVRYHPSDFF